MPNLPSRIICLTEEAVELLYLLGEQERICGVSSFAVRPARVKEKPVVSVFTHANMTKVINMKPDLILGYSDIQKDIARELIEKGQNVMIANHRSLQETLNFCATISHMVGAGEKFVGLHQKWMMKMEEAKSFAEQLQAHLGKPPKVYLEEWDEPRISGIRYFSELVELCGGDDILKSKRDGFLAKERFGEDSEVIEQNPELIFACWCGKKVDFKSILNRQGWEKIPAILNNRVFELPPELFLQPGPALFEEGIDYLINLFSKTYGLTPTQRA